MSRRAPYVNYEENNIWSSIAQQACLTHDHLMDAIRTYYGIDLGVGCRAALRSAGSGANDMAKYYEGRGKDLPLVEFIAQWLVEAF